MQPTPAGGPPAPSTELTQAIEVFLSIGLSPRQILQLAGLFADVCNDTGYGEVRAVLADKRLAGLKKTHSIMPVK